MVSDEKPVHRVAIANADSPIVVVDTHRPIIVALVHFLEDEVFIARIDQEQPIAFLREFLYRG